MTDFILRRPAVQARTGLSRSTLYAMMAEGKFPKPVKLGKRAVGWRESALTNWLDSRSVAPSLVHRAGPAHPPTAGPSNEPPIR